jgi:glycosyltransferase involved in cell wall biosynthesis
VRILLDYRPALRERSGAGEYIHRLARALAAAGTDRVTLFSSSWKDRLDRSAVPGAAIVDRRWPVRLLNLLWHRLGWPPVEHLAGGRFDVAHSGHPLLMPARHAAQVVTIHDLDFLTHPERTGKEVRRDYAALAPRHAARADRIIVPSRYTAAEVERRLRVPPDRLSVCPGGHPGWGPRPSGPREGYILFLGTLEPRKNVSLLLEAYERLLARWPEAPDLVLAGRETSHAASLKATAARPPLAGRVRMPGYVGDDDRRALYTQAGVLVLPSLEEGFGFPPLEAMAAGVPVVVSNRGSLPEVVGDAGTIIDPTDAEGLAHALERLLRNPTLAALAAARGLTRSAQFTWEACAQAVREAYERAVEARRARGGA